jgi:putative SOS response-associated peptidase YedK
MCNLYTTRVSASEVAAHFKARIHLQPNAPEETVPGYPGLVVREHAGERILQSMVWGFPLPQKSKKTGQPIKPKPVNNIADLNSFMWRYVAPKPEHRCIIPLTGFCEAEGDKGAKCRTWFGLKSQPIFAWAGMWKDSAEWGPVYSGLMTDCNEAIRPVHNRMPVLLHEEDYDRWLRGSLEDVVSFQDRCFPDELIEMERTSQPWVRRKAQEAAPA